MRLASFSSSKIQPIRLMINRIYQGRVSRVQVLNAKATGSNPDEWKDLTNGQDLLYENHALFQAATNYYATALLSLAYHPENPIYPIREHLSASDSDSIWSDFTRRGSKHQGLGKSVSKTLGLAPDSTVPEECFSKILSGNDSSQELMDLALRELLDECNGDSAIQQKGREMLPRFCWKGFSGSYPKSLAQQQRKENETRLSLELHLLDRDQQLKEFANETSLAWVVNLNEKAAPYKAAESKDRLRKAVAHFMQAFGEKASTKMGERIRKFISTHENAESYLRALADSIESMNEKDAPTIAKNRKSIPDRSEALLLFKYFPSRFTADLLKESYPFKEKTTKSDERSVTDPLLKFGDDPIQLARGDRGYIFPAFTALPDWGGSDLGEPQWKEFDIAAFKEALKALHQIEAKGAERAKERAKIEKRIARMKHGAKWDFSREADQDAPPVLKGDPRVSRLQKVTESLSETHQIGEYTISQRTIRGLRDLKPKWNQIAPEGSEPSTEKETKLHELLLKRQTSHSYEMGSGAFLKRLTEPENWIIWQTISSETKDQWRKDAKLSDSDDFAENPILALIKLTQMEEEAKRLSEPISFTPADPIHSRRQFYFSDVCNFTTRGDYRIEANASAIIVPAAIKKSGAFTVSRIRILFTAPRLLRDGLRSESNRNLKTAPFLQPMAKALGLPQPIEQDISKHAVALMPDFTSKGERRILLNFPIGLNTTELEDHLGGKSRWARQFAQYDGTNYYLHWPSTANLKKPPANGWWWESLEKYTILSIDLGQRVAAAFARIEAIANPRPASKPQRQIGATGEAPKVKKWKAQLAGSGLLRLPGEDARIMRQGQPQREPYGSKGRPTDAKEWREAKDLCASLGFEPDQFLGADSALYSFPQLNDRLLIAMRRAQGRLAYLQGLSWRLRSDNQKESALNEINDRSDLTAKLANRKALDNSKFLAEEIDSLANQLRATLVDAIVILANRILPNKKQLWEWVSNPNSPQNWILQLGSKSPNEKPRIRGQRGLSMDRITQLEELRRRAQSLNRALSHKLGEKPIFGSSTRRAEAPDPCQEVLEKLDHIREQRVKQTAHLILAEALGVELQPHVLDSKTRSRKDIHGEYRKTKEPVDFIALEDLSRYLSNQGRAPRENSRLMKWCHRAILNTLKELCEPYGIPVVEVNASYSSQFCSRSGVAGFRAEELQEQTAARAPWKGMLHQLDRIEKGETRTDAFRMKQLKHARELFQTLKTINQDREGKKPRSLLAPLKGGPIFIPVEGPAMQADINAAINIGLRAIASPDTHSVFPKVRTVADSEKFTVSQDSKREKARWKEAKYEAEIINPERDKESASKKNLNFFIDLAQFANFGQAASSGLHLPLATSRGLFGTLKSKAWHIANRLNNDRLEKWGYARLLDEGSNDQSHGDELDFQTDDEEDVPY